MSSALLPFIALIHIPARPAISRLRGLHCMTVIGSSCRGWDQTLPFRINAYPILPIGFLQMK